MREKKKFKVGDTVRYVGSLELKERFIGDIFEISRCFYRKDWNYWIYICPKGYWMGDTNIVMVKRKSTSLKEKIYGIFKKGKGVK
jgi:hypothetical protein